jgi:hypothetical protein
MFAYCVKIKNFLQCFFISLFILAVSRLKNRATLLHFECFLCKFRFRFLFVFFLVCITSHFGGKPVEKHRYRQIEIQTNCARLFSFEYFLCKFCFRFLFVFFPVCITSHFGGKSVEKHCYRQIKTQTNRAMLLHFGYFHCMYSVSLQRL